MDQFRTENVRRHGGASASREPRPSERAEDPRPRNPALNPAPPVLDLWTLLEILGRRWLWLLLPGLLLGVGAAGLGFMLFKPEYEATSKVIRFETQNRTEYFKPREFTGQTFGSVLQAPELLQRVASNTSPRLSPEQIAALTTVAAVRESDVVSISVSGDSAESVVKLANLYADEAVAFTRKIQSDEAADANHSLKQQLSELDADIERLNQQFRAMPRAPTGGPLAPSVLEDQLVRARGELANLLAQYTELHPAVITKRAEVEVLQKELAKGGHQPSVSPAVPGTTAPPVPGGQLPPPNAIANTPRAPAGANPSGTNGVPSATGRSSLQQDMVQAQLQALALARLTLASRQREAQMFAENAPGYCRVLAPASTKEVVARSPKLKIGLLGVFGGALGIAAALAMVFLVELFDERIRTAADLRRVTRLPLLATLGYLDDMDKSARVTWAFRTWTALQSHLSPSPNHGLVCGITSSSPSEGRSTWVHLLAEAASECGFRVLTISTGPPRSVHNGQSPRGHDSPQPNFSDHDPASAEAGAAATADVPSPETSPSVQAMSADENSTRAASPSLDRERADQTNSQLPQKGANNAVAGTILSAPGQVTQRLTGGDPQPLVHIPLPGWVWSLERRKHWQGALNHWSKIDNIVILVELPPAASPESVLLAENLPNLVWLSDSGKAKAGKTREQLKTLRDARCHLVGSVLNHEPGPPLTRRFSRWMGCWLLPLLLLLPAGAYAQTPAPVAPGTPAITNPAPGIPSVAPLSPATNPAPAEAAPTLPATPGVAPAANQSQRLQFEILQLQQLQRRLPDGSPEVIRQKAIVQQLQAQATSPGSTTNAPFPGTPDLVQTPPTVAPAPAVPPNTNYSLSVRPDSRAPWQQRLTLGPGDVLNLGLFGRPEVARAEVVVGPDGRISFLQAHDVMASGLTVDELRAAFDQELGKYYRAARTIITPVSWHSKKYYMLGRVVNRGVYVLDRPITVVEAVARARGLETGLLLDVQTSVELADLQRSFLARQGKRMPVDFEKLFYEGDLSQNIPLEPEDYLYFAAANLKEVYVLGEVRNPGTVTYMTSTTIVGAIAARGGFTDKAYKGKVLVVRGSLNRPETFVVDVWGALEAHKTNFKLEPRDIVYVTWRPWSKAEDLLDMGISAFIQSATAAWAGKYVGPIIAHPVLPTP